MIIKVDGKLYRFTEDTISCSECDLHEDCDYTFEETCSDLPMGHFEELKDV
jgi:hypothetical protein